VEGHMHATLHKLGIRGRAELPDALRR
jgi:hypothetical protein